MEKLAGVDLRPMKEASETQLGSEIERTRALLAMVNINLLHLLMG
jgi:hypothetical protein